MRILRRLSLSSHHSSNRALLLPLLSSQSLLTITHSRRYYRQQQASPGASAPSGGALSPRAAFRLLAFHPQAGEEKDAVSKRLKRCYIEGTLKCHPDLFPHDAKATEAFQRLSDALRVALAYHASVFGRGGAGSMGSHDMTDEEDGMRGASSSYSSENVLVALQAAIDEINQPHPSKHSAATRNNNNNRGATNGAGASTRTLAATLEDVTAVCRQQMLTHGKLRTFCHELPTTLCGKKCPLFEVFLFHYPRRAADAEPFILQLSKDLPLLVRRVVKRRTKVIRQAHQHTTGGGAAFGMASGDDARVKRIEDMIMKPLVLVGALIVAPDTNSAEAADLTTFATSSSTRRAANGDTDKESSPTSSEADDRDASASSENGTAAGGSHRGASSSSSRLVAVGRPNISVGGDVKCHKELRCVLCPTDTLDEVVEKVSVWEAASYQRLLVELATGNALSLLSSHLCLVPTKSNLVIQHDLELSLHRCECVGFTVQHLLTEACLHGSGMSTEDTVDENDDREYRTDETATDVNRTTENNADNGGDANKKGKLNTRGQSLAECIVEIRGYAETLDAEAIRGGIHLRVDEADDTLVHHQSEILKPSSSVPTSSEKVTPRGRLAQPPPPPPPPPLPPPPPRKTLFRVTRHPSACEATDLFFAVTVTLQRDALLFFTALRDALREVDRRYNAALEVIPSLVEVRDKVVGDEWLDDISPGEVAGDGGTLPRAAISEGNRDSGSIDDSAKMPRSASSPPPPPPPPPSPPPQAPQRSSLWETSLTDAFDDAFEQHLNNQRPPAPQQSSRTNNSINPRVLNAPSDALPQLRHRAPIRCISRVFNMHAEEEQLLWNRIYEHRVYLSTHQPTIGSWNIYYETSPYESSEHLGGGAAAAGADPMASPSSFTGGGGWCGCSSDGTDMILLTRQDLMGDDVVVGDGTGTASPSSFPSPSSFRLWLEDSVEQSSLSKECQRLLKQHRIGYVDRHSSLPLSHFLSFLTLFTSPAGTAARSLIEARRWSQNSNEPSKLRQVQKGSPTMNISAGDITVQDIGFGIIITTGQCDIRDGGRLHVPWNVDPSHLVAALEGEGGEGRLLDG